MSKRGTWLGILLSFIFGALICLFVFAALRSYGVPVAINAAVSLFATVGIMRTANDGIQAFNSRMIKKIRQRQAQAQPQRVQHRQPPRRPRGQRRR